MAESGKGLPGKVKSASRKARRGKNLSSQAWKKLRHILKRNSVREAFEWANQHNALTTLKQLRPDYQQEMR